MGQHIVKLSDGGESWYLVWSTIVDAPITFGGTLDELTEYLREEYGEAGLRRLPDRLERVERFGTSERGASSVEDTVRVNRAGPGESEIPMSEIIRIYCRERPIDA